VETAVDYFRSEVPPGRSGQWVIEKISMPERDYDPVADARPNCFKYRPGTYTCLRRERTQFMTDLYDEWWTQRAAIVEAAARGGNILITGLGLGLVAEAIFRAKIDRECRVTIIEKSGDVIRLVSPFLRARYGDRIEIHEGDAFVWEPPAGQRFTVGWHDIWPDPYAAENTDEMERLERHHARWCDWQGFWPRAYLKALAA
jgi:hypothetical protein